MARLLGHRQTKGADNRQTNPTATAPHLYSTDGREFQPYRQAHFHKTHLTANAPKFQRLGVAMQIAGLSPDKPCAILQGLSVDIVSAQPSSATPVALKSSVAGVAVVTCLVDSRLRSGSA